MLKFYDVYRSVSQNIFRNQKKNNTGIKKDLYEPFLNCVTLPSVCHLVNRRNFMKSQSFMKALIPEYGFDPTQNYSH